MNSTPKAELTPTSFSLVLPSSHMHCPLTTPRDVAEDLWSDGCGPSLSLTLFPERPNHRVSPWHCSQTWVILADGVLCSGRLESSG